MAVTVARTLEDVEALRPVWERCAPAGIDADIDWFLTVARHRPEVVRPHVIEVAPGALVAGRIEEGPLAARVGPRSIRAPRVRCLSVVADGILGDDADALVGAVVEALSRGEADVALLARLQGGSAVERAARAVRPRRLRDPAPEVVGHWTARVPDDLDAFLRARSRNTRENVRRYARRLEREHGATLRMRAYGPGDDADEVCALLDAIAARTYQRALGVGFTGSVLDRRLVELGLARGWFRAWVLWLEGRPVAFWSGNAYRGTFRIGSPGFDPAFAPLRIGQYLHVEMLRALCADPAVDRIDYGWGDAQYKRSFGDTRGERVDVLLCAPTAAGARARIVRGAARRADRAARAVAARTGPGRRLERAWRGRRRSAA